MLSVSLLLTIVSSIGLGVGILTKDLILIVIALSLFLISITLTKKSFFPMTFLFFTVALLRTFYTFPSIISTLNSDVKKENVVIEGIVDDFFDLSSENFVLVIKTERIDGVPANIFIKVYTHNIPPPKNSRVEFEGKIEKTNANIFDYKSRFITTSQHFTIKESSKINEMLSELRLSIVGRVRSTLKSEAGNLLLSSLLGINALESETKKDFQIVGVGHIFAISGLHIGTLFFFFSHILGNFTVYGNILSLIFVILFLVFIGLKYSALRAVLMLFVFVLGEELGRGRNFLNSLLVSMCIILACFPESIISVSFYLSCVAILGLILSEKVSTKNKALTLLKASFFVNLYETPILTYFFNLFSSSSPLLNVFVIPYMGILLPIGLIYVLVVLVSVNISKPFAGIVNFLYLILLKSVEFFSSLPISYMYLNIGLIQFIILIVILFIFTVLLKADTRKKKIFLPILLVIYAFTLFSRTYTHNLDVGYTGDSKIIVFQEGYSSYVFILPKQSISSEVSDTTIDSILKKNGVNTIETLFLLKTPSIKEGSEIANLGRKSYRINLVVALDSIDEDFITLNFAKFRFVPDKFQYKKGDITVLFDTSNLTILDGDKSIYP